jgi:hypothetical protein
MDCRPGNDAGERAILPIKGRDGDARHGEVPGRPSRLTSLAPQDDGRASNQAAAAQL